jgi:hypothetical protein
MPAMTRPRTSRPATPRIPTRPQPGHKPAIASDGLTVDTELGFVDLVAVKRALAGDDRVRLTEAEHAWIRNRTRSDVRHAADALGTGYTGLLRDVARHRRHTDRSETAS